MDKRIEDKVSFLLVILFSFNWNACQFVPNEDTYSYSIVDTNQHLCFNEQTTIPTPQKGEAFFGQNAQYRNAIPDYGDNNDGTISDNVTGLMWQKSIDHNNDGKINEQDKYSYPAIVRMPDTTRTGGYHDWRLPTIKELYSLVLFTTQVSDKNNRLNYKALFIDTTCFQLSFGTVESIKTINEIQVASITVNRNKMQSLVYGVNFANGQVEASDVGMRGRVNKYKYLFVRGNSLYGQNKFIDNGDNTITDVATGLMWAKTDSKKGMNWKSALAYCEKANLAGHSDWRLPNAKELQSIVDYTRNPETILSASIDPVFEISTIENDRLDWPRFWTNTTTQGSDNDSHTHALSFTFGRTTKEPPFGMHRRPRPSEHRMMGKPNRPQGEYPPMRMRMMGRGVLIADNIQKPPRRITPFEKGHLMGINRKLPMKYFYENAEAQRLQSSPKIETSSNNRANLFVRLVRTANQPI